MMFHHCLSTICLCHTTEKTARNFFRFTNRTKMGLFLLDRILIGASENLWNGRLLLILVTSGFRYIGQTRRPVFIQVQKRSRCHEEVTALYPILSENRCDRCSVAASNSLNLVCR